MMTIKPICVIGNVLLALTLCGNATAGPSWLCAIADAVAVDEDGTIGEPDLGGLERPTFFRVDTDKKQITLLAPESRRGEITKIDAVHKGKGLWVFSGVEEGRAWSLVISTKGHVTLSVTGDGATWAVFGHALLEDPSRSKG
jgi:hypothetical protein